MTAPSAPTASLYELEGTCRQHRYVCLLCTEKGEWARSASVAHDGARHHLATEHEWTGVQW